MLGTDLLLVRLKEKTALKHKEAHGLGFFKALLKHQLPKECYIGQLRTLSIIFGALERELKNNYPNFNKFIENGYKEKLPLLLEDIYALEPKGF